MAGVGDHDELLAALKRFDPYAWERLVGDHYSRMRRVALSRRFSEVDADEIASETFAIAARRIRSYVPDKGLDRWLGAIAWNQMLKRWAAAKAAPTIEDIDGLVGTKDEPRAAPTSGVNEGRRANAWPNLELGLSRIRPRKYADAVVMHDINGMGYPEVAAALHLGTAEAARVYVFRGRKALKALLEKQAEEGPKC